MIFHLPRREKRVLRDRRHEMAYSGCRVKKHPVTGNKSLWSIVHHGTIQAGPDLRESDNERYFIDRNRFPARRWHMT